MYYHRPISIMAILTVGKFNVHLTERIHDILRGHQPQHGVLMQHWGMTPGE